MLLPLMYLAIMMCVAGIAVALMPAPLAQWSRLPTTSRLSRPSANRESRWDEVKHNLFAPALSFAGHWMSRTGDHREALTGRLLYIGSSLTAEQVTGLKVVTAIAGLVTAMSLSLEFGTIHPPIILAGGVVGFLVPDLWLRQRIRRRNKAILRLLPEVIDLLALCIGAGMDFLGALNKLVMVKGFKGEPLIEELSMVMQEIKLGKRRFEALKTMVKRVELPELTSFVRTLVQADRMGTPIGEVLAIHSEDVRLQRFMRAERVALKAPIKILVPLIFCIMPCVGIIVGAPVLIQFMRQNPFAK